MKSKLMAISVSLLLALMVTPVLAKSIGPQKAVKNPHITIMPEGVELLLPSGVAKEWVADTEISVMDFEHILNASKFKIRNAMPITIEDLMEIMTDPEAALEAENKWGYMSYEVMEDFFEWLISIGYPISPEEVELILSMYPEGMYIMYVNVGQKELEELSAWLNRMNRHAKPDIEKLAGIKKERLDAKCYYAVYAASHKEDECWWNIVRKMCDEKEISFLLGWKK